MVIRTVATKLEFFVIKLRASLPTRQNFKLYFDIGSLTLSFSFFCKHLASWSVGAVCSNQLRGCVLKSGKELKEMEHDTSGMSVGANSGLVVVRLDWIGLSSVLCPRQHSIGYRKT